MLNPSANCQIIKEAKWQITQETKLRKDSRHHFSLAGNSSSRIGHTLTRDFQFPEKEYQYRIWQRLHGLTQDAVTDAIHNMHKAEHFAGSRYNRFCNGTL